MTRHKHTTTTRFHSSKQPPSRGKFMAPPSSFLAATAGSNCEAAAHGAGSGAAFVLQ